MKEMVWATVALRCVDSSHLLRRIAASPEGPPSVLAANARPVGIRFCEHGVNECRSLRLVLGVSVWALVVDLLELAELVCRTGHGVSLSRSDTHLTHDRRSRVP